MSEEIQAAHDNTEAAQNTESVTAEEHEKNLQETFYGSEEKEESNEDSDQEEVNEEKEEAETEKESEDEGSDEEAEDSEESKEVDYSDLKAPEGSKLNSADSEKIIEFAKENNLSKDAAEKLLKQVSESREEYFSSLQTEFKEKVKQWESDTKADKEVGGDGFKKNVELSRQVVERFGTKEFKDMVNNTGFGSHPEVVRMFSRIGKAMDSDSFVKSGSKSSGERSIEEIFYGKSN
jgi:hypothetical protein